MKSLLPYLTAGLFVAVVVSIFYIIFKRDYPKNRKRFNASPITRMDINQGLKRHDLLYFFDFENPDSVQCILILNPSPTPGTILYAQVSLSMRETFGAGYLSKLQYNDQNKIELHEFYLKKFFVPERAIVPKLSCKSFLVIPIPESVIVNVGLSPSWNSINIFGSYLRDLKSSFVSVRYLSLSSASEAFEINSLRKISL